METPLGPKYTPYTYMDPLGSVCMPLDGCRDKVAECCRCRARNLRIFSFKFRFRVWGLGFRV